MAKPTKPPQSRESGGERPVSEDPVSEDPVSEEEAALAEQLAAALDGRFPKPSVTEDGHPPALEPFLESALLLKSSGKFELSPDRQADIRSELDQAFEERIAQTTGPERKRWLRWVTVPSLAVAGFGAVWLLTVAPTEERAHVMTRTAIESPAPGEARFAAVPARSKGNDMRGVELQLLQAQADALRATLLENAADQARQTLDQQLSQYRKNMLTSLDVRLR